MHFRLALALTFSLCVNVVHVACVSTPVQAQQAPGEFKGATAASITPANFRWQRSITPPLLNPLAEACIVLDAKTFANAAPALRDLRLYQDGSELPFAVEQSFDERALRSGVTPPDDRSLYEVSAVANVQKDRLAAPDAIPRVTDKSLKAKSQNIPDFGFYGHIWLPAHVPVERIRTQPSPTGREHLRISAREMYASRLPDATETVDGVLDQGQPALPLTLGANLQNSADIDLDITSNQMLSSVIFEMRRRSLCYRPRSASPLTLYLGGSDGMPAESYAFARSFQSSNDRPYAKLGPLLPNPLLHPVMPQHFAFSRNLRVTTVVLAVCALFLFNTQRLFRKHNRSSAP